MSETMRLRARVGVPLKEVHRALTDAEALRIWLAEHAEVELPDRYEFWGSFTPEGAEPHQSLLYVDEQTLRFSWELEGEETTVEIGLEEESTDSTILALSQTNTPSWHETVAESSLRAVLYTYWSLAIANLIDYLEGRHLTPMCDFTSPVMRDHVIIGATPAEVFDSLIDPDKFTSWFGANVDLEPHVGGRLAMGGFDVMADPAIITELEPDERLTINWGSFVSSWELEDVAGSGATRLTFVHSGFDERKPPYGGWMGWLAGVAELRRFHELADYRRVWLDVQMPGMPEGILADQ